MTPEQLDTIIEHSAGKLAECLRDLHPRIRESAAAALEESQDSDTGKAKVSIGLKLVIDVNQSPPAWHVEAAVGVRFKTTSEIEQLDETPELEPGLGKSRKGKRPVEATLTIVEDDAS